MHASNRQRLVDVADAERRARRGRDGVRARESAAEGDGKEGTEDVGHRKGGVKWSCMT